MKAFHFLLFVIVLLHYSFADIYLHNPRGSNNRVNEGNVNRNNANRLFDSQNNGKGGYCLGPMMYFYERSQLTIEYTVQHGCGNPKLQCNLVMQYMCSDIDAPADIRVRDGYGTTDTITQNTVETRADAFTAPEYREEKLVLKYGQHEPFSHYDACQTRRRNYGLFTADRTKNGLRVNNQDAATRTRQNNAATRHGFECAEERDYYPYWHPSPWIDIAVLTDDMDHCKLYKEESQNVKAKNLCTTPNGGPAQANNEQDCNAAGNKWIKVKSHNKSPPDCLPAPWNRDNHLGNGIKGFNSIYNWTLPTTNEDKYCVFRLRYNISTKDYDAWKTDWKSNDVKSPILQDPIVKIDSTGAEMELAVDTSQFGRTFQDRSHTFVLRSRPKTIEPLRRIYNLNVRGKRGNIVQTYPAVEYDFVPQALEINKNDMIHFQWTGCDTNPNGNAGEGAAGTDRSNIIELAGFAENYPAKKNSLFDSNWLRKYAAYGTERCPHCTDSDYEYNVREYNCWMTEPGNGADQRCTVCAAEDADDDNADTNCAKHNPQYKRYFDTGPLEVNTTGLFYFMSSRNNNFTNRSQKGYIAVDRLLPSWAIALIVIGGLLFGLAGLISVGMLYSRNHPHGKVAQILSRF